MNKTEFQVILGSMFGDGFVLKKDATHYQYFEKHCIKQVKYLRWKYDLLRRFHPRFYSYDDECRLETRSSVEFDFFRKKFYPKGVRHKIISYDMLKLLTPLGLAIWYMDDGCYTYRYKMVFLYSRTDNKRYQIIMKKYFENELNIYPTISKNHDGFCIGFSGNERDKFLRLIEKYVHPIFDYKLGYLRDSNSARVVAEDKKVSDYYKEYRKMNLKSISLKRKEYYRKNRSKIKSRVRKYYAKNREKILLKYKEQKIKEI
jgi:hypothetical protein